MGHPLLSWDIFTDSYRQLLQNSKQVRKDLADIDKLSRQYKWQQPVNCQPFLLSPQHAVIITDTAEHIVWVSHHFQQLTGYSSAEIIGHTFSVLQRPGTSAEAQKQLRRLLAGHGPVKALQLLLYRKNEQPYYCSLRITPVYNTAGRLVHFICLVAKMVE